MGIWVTDGGMHLTQITAGSIQSRLSAVQGTAVGSRAEDFSQIRAITVPDHQDWKYELSLNNTGYMKVLQCNISSAFRPSSVTILDYEDFCAKEEGECVCVFSVCV